MSRIYFHTPDKSVEVAGRERNYMSRLISNYFISIFRIPFFSNECPQFWSLFPTAYFVKELEDKIENSWLSLKRSVELYLTVGDAEFVINGNKFDIWGAQLNTVLSSGNECMKLMARLHGQCEIHCYVEPENKKWLADVIKQGLSKEIYRSNSGWEDLIKLLEETTDTVVCSYSVCEQFPNAYINDLDYREWEELSSQEQWNLSLREIRKKPSLEIKPDPENTYYFTHGWDAFKLNKLVQLPVSEWCADWSLL